MQEVEVLEQEVNTDYKDAQGYQGVDNYQAEKDPFDVDDRTVVCSKNTKTQTPKVQEQEPQRNPIQTLPLG